MAEILKVKKICKKGILDNISFTVEEAVMR